MPHLKTDNQSASLLNAVTNRGTTLYDALKKDLAEAVHIRMMVSFVMEKGVALILDDLQQAAARGVPIQLLTSTYLGITEPAASHVQPQRFRRIQLHLPRKWSRNDAGVGEGGTRC